MKLLKTILVFIGLKIIEIVGFVTAFALTGAIGAAVAKYVFNAKMLPTIYESIGLGFLMFWGFGGLAAIVAYFLYLLCKDNWNRAKRIARRQVCKAKKS